MSHKHINVKPGYRIGTVFDEDGNELTPPEGWAFLAAGDAAVTRCVKSKGGVWVVQVLKGKRIISKGVWANGSDIAAAQLEVAEKRATPQYKMRRQQEQARKEKKHNAYTREFFSEVITYLGFHPRYQEQAEILARKVTDHATPVGSGTVARTNRIPVGDRAEAAVIAWMRHQTTAYDSMKIARVKGRRRETRRMLAAQSVAILTRYRQGADITGDCPLQKSLLKES